MNFFTNAKNTNDVAIFLETGQEITYFRLNELTDNFLSYLTARSIIFIVGSNDLPSIVCYLASIKIDAVPLLLGKNIDQQLLISLIKKYEPKYLFTTEAEGEILDLFNDVKQYESYTLYINKNNTSIPLNSSLSLLLATSGSTGSPKLVRLSRENIYSNSSSIIKYLDIGNTDRAITSLPFNYSYGLSVINSHLFAGASIVLCNKSMFDREFWKMAELYSVTSIAGVPYNYDILLKLKFKNINLPALKILTQAGGKLDISKINSVYQVCNQKGIKFYIMYGQTEATARMAYLDPVELPDKAGSIGKEIPGGKLWLEDQNGCQITEPYIIGELVYSGPNVSMGYAENSDDLILGDLNNGVLRTGDLAEFDRDGFYYIKGRVKRFIKIYGLRVDLDSLEQTLSEKGFMSAVSGEDDDLRIVIESYSNIDVQSLKSQISALLNVHPTAVKLATVDSLPRLNSGKINYEKVKNIFD